MALAARGDCPTHTAQVPSPLPCVRAAVQCVRAEAAAVCNSVDFGSAFFYGLFSLHASNLTQLHTSVQNPTMCLTRNELNP
jgi:hypothetical protein